MFERFTDRARRVVVLAQEEARMLNHNYIGTEHLLIALMAEGEAVAWQVLTDLGLNVGDLRDAVEEIIGIGVVDVRGHIPFTPQSKKCLELALREALKYGHNYIGTEHLLLGVIREGEGVACQVVEKFDVELPAVKAAVLEALGVEAVTFPPLVVEVTTVGEMMERIITGLADLRSDVAALREQTANVTVHIDRRAITEALAADRQIR